MNIVVVTMYKGHPITKLNGFFWALGIGFKKITRAKQEIDKEEAGNE